jgi:hypothetical protein
VLQLDTGEQTAEQRAKRTRFEQADNGERRTTQVLQLDTAEQTAEQYYFELLSQLGETPGRPTGHEFLADENAKFD